MNRKELLLRRMSNIKKYNWEVDKQSSPTVKKNRSKYHINNMPKFTKVKKDVVKPYKNNSWDHELAKFRLCWELLRINHSFITEAVSKETGERHDVVDLDSGYVYEIETTKKRAERFKGRKNVIVVELWEDKAISGYVEG